MQILEPSYFLQRRENPSLVLIGDSKATFHKADVDLDSNGCVVCSTTPECPVCEKNQQCAMTTQTCAECPTTYCLDISDNVNSTSTSKSLSSAQVGGIAGGLSGLFFILLIGVIYFFFRKYKNHINIDYESGINEEMKELAGFYDDDYDNNRNNDNEADDELGDLRNSNGRNIRADRRRNHPNEKRMSQNSLQTMTNSVLTKASNVLNIGYVPGVTSVRPKRPPTIGANRRNTRRQAASIYSKGMSVYSKETYFSDLENASFHGGNVATRAGNPTLVVIKQDDYNFDDKGSNSKFENSDDEDDVDTESNFPININLQLPDEKNGNITEEKEEVGNDRLTHSKARSIRSNYTLEEESDGDDNNDIQLNIGLSKAAIPSVPTRYGALVDKKNQTIIDPFSSADHEDSFSETSSSDSDEENIEMLLQNHNNSNSNVNSNTNTFTQSSNTVSNPFSSHMDS